MICAAAFVWHAAYEQYRNISMLLIRRVPWRKLRLLQLATSVRSSFKCHTHRHTQRQAEAHPLTHTQTRSKFDEIFMAQSMCACVCVCVYGISVLCFSSGHPCPCLDKQRPSAARPALEQRR